VPKFPSIPRVSIIVPIGRDLAAFESTLISILELQPAGCEVLVVHDGSYDDPFQLCDEVRFVTTPSSRLSDLVAAGAIESRARFVHVLADGIRATAGWLDGALEKFEHFDAACVAPVIRQAKTCKVLSAGWCDGTDRLCKSACRGKVDLTTDQKMIGAFLQASFWRREVLRSLSAAYLGEDSDAVTTAYAYEHLMRKAGWRTVLATECELEYDQAQLPWDVSSFGRGKQLRAIRSFFTQKAGWSPAIRAAANATIANLVRPGQLLEAIGQSCSPLLAAQVSSQIQLDAVTPCDEEKVIIAMPNSSKPVAIRRAA
jgi:hypothetical protein